MRTCPNACGQPPQRNGTAELVCRDIPLDGRSGHREFVTTRRQFHCPGCGRNWLEDSPGIRPDFRMSDDLYAAIWRACLSSAFTDVARHFDLPETTVRAVFAEASVELLTAGRPAAMPPALRTAIRNELLALMPSCARRLRKWLDGGDRRALRAVEDVLSAPAPAADALARLGRACAQSGRIDEFRSRRDALLAVFEAADAPAALSRWDAWQQTLSEATGDAFLPAISLVRRLSAMIFAGQELDAEGADACPPDQIRRAAVRLALAAGQSADIKAAR